jgi:hypothetical protein
VLKRRELELIRMNSCGNNKHPMYENDEEEEETQPQCFRDQVVGLSITPLSGSVYKQIENDRNISVIS